MHVPTFAELIPLIQTAIGPVILISGVGLLLLSMTNRFGRAIDRARILGAHLPPKGDPARRAIESQLHILWKRARLIRHAITFAACSALSAALLIICLFLAPLLHIGTGIPVVGFFVTAMGCLVGALGLFLHDLKLSLLALRLELDTQGVTEQ